MESEREGGREGRKGEDKRDGENTQDPRGGLSFTLPPRRGGTRGSGGREGFFASAAKLLTGKARMRILLSFFIRALLFIMSGFRSRARRRYSSPQKCRPDVKAASASARRRVHIDARTRTRTHHAHLGASAHTHIHTQHTRTRRCSAGP